MRIAFKQERMLYVLENPIPLMHETNTHYLYMNRLIDYNEFPT